MITPKEYIKAGSPEKAFFYVTEIFDHMMTAHESPTFGLRPGDRQDRLDFHRSIVKAEMEKQNFDAQDLNAELDTFERRRRHREKDSDSGNLDVDRYLNGDPRPFVDVFSEPLPKPAKTLLIDMSIMSGERGGDDMRRRHKYIYREAVKAEQEGTPLRVIAAFANGIDERNGNSIKTYVIIKDYQDPIFPEIWACFKTNASTNSTYNLISFTCQGTESYSNGHAAILNASNDFPEDEEIILIDAKRITCNHAKTVSAPE